MTSRSSGLTPMQAEHAATLPQPERARYEAECRHWNANRPTGGRRVWMGTQEERDRQNEHMMREHRLGRWHW